MKPKGRRKAKKTAPAPRARVEDRGEPSELAGTILDHPEGGPRLSGGDVDADWMSAESTGDEAVGGSTATPDQDVVDEIGRALGVEQDVTAEVRTSAEILAERDRYRWRLEREAEVEADAEEAGSAPEEKEEEP